MNKLFYLTFGVVLCIVGLFISNIMLSAQLSHQGIELKKMNEEIVELSKTNEEISLQIVDKTAISNLRLQAYEFGFTDKIEYINLTTMKQYALR